MFGDNDASACCDKRGGGRDVERVLAVAAGANDVHCAFGGRYRQTLGAHDGGGSCVFIHGFTTGAHCHKKPANLRRSRIAHE